MEGLAPLDGGNSSVALRGGTLIGASKEAVIHA